MRKSLHNKQVELDLELEFQKRAAILGIAARKYIDPNRRGGPDRICFCPGAHTFFVEFKKPGESLDPLQVEYKEELEKLDYRVYVCDNLDDAIYILRLENQLMKEKLKRH